MTEMMKAGYIFDVRDFGAAGDGLQEDTAAVQAALDACGQARGGTVLLPAGQYHVGTLFLRSNVNLHLMPDAELLGSRDIALYSDKVTGCIEGPNFNKCLIYAEGCRNITLSGQGTINGRGFREDFPETKEDGRVNERPMLLRFVECSGITLTDLTLTNSASWCCNFLDCHRIKIDRVNIENRANQNNDGFDLDSCSDAVISNCSISSIDDSICLKSTRPEPCRNIAVTNCVVSSDTAALKFGSASRSGFRNVAVSNCAFHHCRKGAIKLLLVDGGVLENVVISNITMDDVDGPLFIRLGNRGLTFEAPRMMNYGDPDEEEGKSLPGIIRNVQISNIMAVVGGTEKEKCGMMITGVPGGIIENIFLSNIQVTFPGGGTKEDARREIAEDEARYPEQCFFGVLPSWGLFARHIRGLRLDNVQFFLATPDARPALFCEDVADLDISNSNLAP